MKSGFYTHELDDMLEDFTALAGKRADAIATQIIHSMGEDIGKLAERYAPRDTGELADSIEVDNSTKLETRVRATAPHAAFVEFGTWSHNVFNPQVGTYEIRPREADALRFIGSDGVPVFTRVVNHPGIEPNPFMGRATMEVLDDYSKRIERALAMGVMGL